MTRPPLAPVAGAMAALDLSPSQIPAAALLTRTMAALDLSPARIASAAVLARGMAALDDADDVILDGNHARLLNDADYRELRDYARSLGYTLETNEDGEIIAYDDANE